MRRTAFFVFLIFCVSVSAQEVVTIDLAVADPAAARTYAASPGKITLKIINALPGETYLTVGENQSVAVPKLSGTVASAAGCTPADQQLARILKDAKKEQDVADALKASGCKGAELTALQDLVTQSFTGYSIDAGEMLPKTIKRKGSDVTWPILITTQGASAAATAAAAAKAANPKAGDNPNLDRLLKLTADSEKLFIGECNYDDNTCAPEIHINADQVSTLTIKDIRKGKVKVTVTAGELFNCRALSYNFAVFDSAPDRIIVPLHMPRGLLGVGGTSMARAQAEAGKLYGLDFCPGTGEAIDTRRFASVRDDATVQHEVETRYGITGRSDRTGSTPPNRIPSTQSESATEKTRTLAELPDPRLETVADPMAKPALQAQSELRPTPQPQPAPQPQSVQPTRNLFPRGVEPQTASLPLFLRGKAQVVDVLFEWADGERKSFTIPVRYQRFWLDAGGFFVFTRHTDQRIETEVVPAVPVSETVAVATPERRKVTALRRENSYDPSTGIVINVHPGNAPALAFQFGIATNQGRLPSYYLGIGARAREIGKRGLATIAVGVAMQQEANFSQIAVGETVPPDSPRLQPTQKYAFTFPYVSISLGFSFGGISERTNVASSVTTAR